MSDPLPPQPLPPPNALIGRERIRGATRMIAEGTDAKDVTAEQIQQVAADVETFRRAYKISVKELAKANGRSSSVISEFLAGKYGGDNGQVAIDLEDWLVTEEHRRSRPELTQFVWTNVALEIKGVANYARDKRKIAMICGPDSSGVGKTTALRAIQQELGPRKCAMATIDKVDANPTGLLKKLLRAVGKDDNGSNAQRKDRLVEYLSGRQHLLIVDQAHNLRFSKDDKPFYILTDLFDATGSAQLWCGTADLVNYLQKQRRRNGDESLSQVGSRIFPIVDLMESLRAGGGDGGEPLVTVEQVREMFARNKLKLTAGGVRFVCELCNLPDSGCVRLAVQVVEYATMLAELRRAVSIDVPLLQEAMRRGFSPHHADALMRRVEADRTERVAKVG